MEVQILNNVVYVYGNNILVLFKQLLPYPSAFWFAVKKLLTTFFTHVIKNYIRWADQKAQSLGHGLLNFIIEKACP